MPVRTSAPRPLARFVAVGATVVAMAACGAEAAPPAAPPPRLEGLTATSLAELDVDRLAGEALDVASAGGFLRDNGFRSAVERTYTGRTPGIRRVQVRVVAFETAPQAERYVAWQREHVADVIGDARVAGGDAVDGVPIHVHLPDGCCAKETSIALAVWSRGAEVVRVLVAGPDADDEVGIRVIRSVHETVATDA